jgi:hypothetical protein
MEHNMKSLLAAAILAVGLSGVSAGMAVADKTRSSDPAPSTVTSGKQYVVYCNRSHTKCWRRHTSN